MFYKEKNDITYAVEKKEEIFFKDHLKPICLDRGFELGK